MNAGDFKQVGKWLIAGLRPDPCDLKRLNSQCPGELRYTVRESARARSIRLRVTPRNGLEVIVPRGCCRSRIAPILEKEQRWIKSALERAEALRARYAPEAAWQVPAQIEFAAFQKSWRVMTCPDAADHVSVRDHGDGILRLHGNISLPHACRAALQRWWLCQGREHLVPLLDEISRATGWDYGRVAVRCQRTRWGSCSRHKTISLNARLLFLAPELVRYVMIHELCHTREMNHAARFRENVRAWCPDCRSLKKHLRQAWNSVPSWAGSEYE